MKALVALAAGGAVLAAVLVLETGRTTAPRNVVERPVDSADLVEEQGNRERMESVVGVGPPVDQVPSAKEFLSHYWGARWSEIQPRMLSAGLDLETPFAPAPWADVSAGFEPLVPMDDAHRLAVMNRIIGWPRAEELESLANWLKKEFPVREEMTIESSHADAVQTMAMPYNDELYLLSMDYVNGIDESLMQCWRSGDFVKAPFSTEGVSGEKGFYAVTHARDGWSIVITLKAEDYPDLVVIREKAARLRRERDSSVERYLRDHGYCR